MFKYKFHILVDLREAVCNIIAYIYIYIYSILRRAEECFIIQRMNMFILFCVIYIMYFL